MKYQDSPILGFLIGMAICALITLFSMCSCKTQKTTTDTDSLHIIHATTQTFQKTETTLNSQLSTLNTQNNQEMFWRQKVTTISYSLPDSLGNQFILSIATEENDRGMTNNISQQSTLNSQTTTQTSQKETIIDTLYIDRVKTKTVVKNKPAPLPWYYKLIITALAISLILSLLYILYIRYRRRPNQQTIKQPND